MTMTELLVGRALPYVALIGFLCGVAYRLAVWRRTPQPGKLTLYPTRGWTAAAIVKETLFFPTLYRGDRTLWWMAWSFHVALALAFVGHFRVVTGLVDSLLGGLGLSDGGIEKLSALAGGGAGLVLLAAAATLVCRRLALKRVREISSLPDFLALFLLTAVIVTGNLMRFAATPVDLIEVRRWVASLATSTPVVPQSSAVLLHVFCAELLVLYLGFSKLMHFGGFYYSLSLVRRS
jgi:nitrate reductase gamma subunit